jgi:hypothetical protein
MNNKIRERMWPQNQFVFTLPACGFVVTLNLDWCPDANEAIVNGESNQEGQRSFTSEPHDRIPRFTPLTR